MRQKAMSRKPKDEPMRFFQGVVFHFIAIISFPPSISWHLPKQMHEMQKTEQIDKKIKFPFKSWLLPFLFVLQRSLAVMANSGRCTRVHMHTHKRACMALVLHYPNIHPPWKTLPGFVGVPWLGLNLLLSLSHTQTTCVTETAVCTFARRVHA